MTETEISAFSSNYKDEKELTRATEHEAVKAIPQTIRATLSRAARTNVSTRSGSPHAKAAPSYSNFDIAAYLTEIMLLGLRGIANRYKNSSWDGPKMRAKNSREAAQYVRREYRKGWKL